MPPDASQDDLDLIARDVLSRHRPDGLLGDRCSTCTPYGHFDVPPDPVPWPCPIALAAMRAAPTVASVSAPDGIIHRMSDTDRPDPTDDDQGTLHLDDGGNDDWLRRTARARDDRDRKGRPGPDGPSKATG